MQEGARDVAWTAPSDRASDTPSPRDCRTAPGRASTGCLPVGRAACWTRRARGARSIGGGTRPRCWRAWPQRLCRDGGRSARVPARGRSDAGPPRSGWCSPRPGSAPATRSGTVSISTLAWSCRRGTAPSSNASAGTPCARRWRTIGFTHAGRPGGPRPPPSLGRWHDAARLRSRGTAGAACGAHSRRVRGSTSCCITGCWARGHRGGRGSRTRGARRRSSGMRAAGRLPLA